MSSKEARGVKYAFFGTPDFAAVILEKLIESGLPPALLVCNPDRPVGRKKVMTPPPTKVLAQKHDIMVWQPEGLKVESWKSKIEELGGIDFCVVAAYSKIIPKAILDTLPAKFVGVHPSLLSRHRGASPIQNTILSGDNKTGVTLYLLDEKTDHGPVLASREFPISNLQFLNLQQELAKVGGELLVQILPKFLSGEIEPQVQNEEYATYTEKFETKDAFVDPEDLREAQDGASSEKAEKIYRKILALNPEPGVWTIKDGKRMKILEAEIKEEKLVLKRIQFEGKKPQDS